MTPPGPRPTRYTVALDLPGGRRVTWTGDAQTSADASQVAVEWWARREPESARLAVVRQVVEGDPEPRRWW